MKKKLNVVKDLKKSQRPNQNESVSMDETTYLLSNEANKKRLLDSINQMNQGVFHNYKLIE